MNSILTPPRSASHPHSRILRVLVTRSWSSQTNYASCNTVSFQLTLSTTPLPAPYRVIRSPSRSPKSTNTDDTMSNLPGLKPCSSSGYSSYGTSPSSDIEIDPEAEHRIVKDHSHLISSSTSTHRLVLGSLNKQSRGNGGTSFHIPLSSIPCLETVLPVREYTT